MGSCPSHQGSSKPELIPVSVALSNLRVLLPLDGILVHRRIPPQFTLIPIPTPGSREAIRVKCLAQGHKQQMVPRPSIEPGPPAPKSGTLPLHHRSPFNINQHKLVLINKTTVKITVGCSMYKGKICSWEQKLLLNVQDRQVINVSRFYYLTL